MATAPSPLDVSVVVVTHESDHRIGRCLDGLLDCGLDPARILVVDNASTDATVARARGRGVRVVETGCNAGFGAACNAGLAQAGTPLVAFATPDATVGREALVRVLAALGDDPRAAAAGPLLSGRPSLARFSTIASDLGWLAPRPLGRPLRRLVREVPLRGGQLGRAVVADYAEGAFLVCRAHAVRAVGGFDERFFLYGEDEDLCRRLAAAGWRTLVVTAARARHAGTASSRGATAGSLAPHRLRGRYLLYRKHRSRLYAELARVALGAAVALDRLLRAALRRPQVLGPGTLRALAGAHRRGPR